MPEFNSQKKFYYAIFLYKIVSNIFSMREKIVKRARQYVKDVSHEAEMPLKRTVVFPITTEGGESR
jgi:hypothetical protein